MIDVSKHIKQQTRLCDLANEFNGGWEPNWDDLTQEKYMIYFDHHKDHLRYKFRAYGRGNNFGVAFSHEAVLQCVVILNVEGL